jgi:hypothetical protein
MAIRFLRRLRALGRQVLDLFRHNGKSFTVYPGPSSLNRRIERQDIGLERDIFNRLDVLEISDEA